MSRSDVTTFNAPNSNRDQLRFFPHGSEIDAIVKDHWGRMPRRQFRFPDDACLRSDFCRQGIQRLSQTRAVLSAELWPRCAGQFFGLLQQGGLCRGEALRPVRHGQRRHVGLLGRAHCRPNKLLQYQ